MAYRIMNWFTDYLFLRKQIINLRAYCQNLTLFSQVFPQGSILGPLLFLIHFNDVHRSLRYSKIITDADGSVIFTSSKDLNEDNNSPPGFEITNLNLHTHFYKTYNTALTP